MIEVPMNPVFEFIFAQYLSYPKLFVIVEGIAIVFGILSVWFSRQNSVLVFPTGIISTSLFVYILYQSGLLGDLLINAYYFIMSIYGWFYWTRVNNRQQTTPISVTSLKDYKRCLLIFLSTVSLVFLIYLSSNRLSSWTAYVDTLTTGIFFVGMWLMARRKLQHWLCWIVGDMISVPLYAYKGLILTSIQFLIFTVMAVSGYYNWQKILKADSQSG